jgi:hypothetical protein
MSARARGLLLGVAQLLMVGSLGAVFLLDRARLPRAWVRTMPAAAGTALEGKYLQLQLAVETRDAIPLRRDSTAWITLVADSGRAWARPVPRGQGLRARQVLLDGQLRLVLQDRLAYYIPNAAADPRPVAAGAELWVEVSVPPEGPPRLLRLGLRRPDADGTPQVVPGP